MFYVIENPSDAMTLEADEDLIAALAGLYLGQGRIGITNENDESVLPIFLLGGDEALVSWLKSVGIDGIEGMKANLLNRKDEIAVCLESLVYGGVAEHKWINQTLKAMDHVDRTKAIYEWNDMKRSSMNDYQKSAFQLAKEIRELKEEDITPPPKAEPEVEISADV